MQFLFAILVFLNFIPAQLSIQFSFCLNMFCNIYMHLICNQLQLIYKYGEKELKQSSKLVPIHKTFLG